jgi:LacI family transcriptional regulator
MSRDLSVTLQDVATQAGVSAMTVSRVINTPERVSPSTRERIESAIQTLGYTPNALARGLKGSTRTLALVIPDVSNPFFTDIVHGAEEVARKHGYTVFLGNTDSSSENEKNYLHKMLGHRIDGLLIVPMGDRSKDVLQKVRARGVPFVLIDVKVPGVSAEYVVGDNKAGAFALTEHLIKLGHKRIALVSGRSDLSTSREREEGYAAALQHYKINANRNYQKPTDFSREAGYHAVSSLLALPNPPTALFVASNVLAIGALEAVRASGLRVPEDIALVCFEDIGMASALQPFLTVMAQPAKAFGRFGAEFLIGRIANPQQPKQHKVLMPQLIVRLSCGSSVRHY